MEVKSTLVGSAYSKTQWFALAVIIVGVLQDQGQFLTSLFGEDISGKVLAATGIVMAILRAVTTSSLKEKANLK